MRTFILLLSLTTLVLSANVTVEEQSVFINKDCVCNTIIENEKTLADINLDIGDLTVTSALLLRRNEEITRLVERLRIHNPTPVSRFERQDLDECRDQVDDFNAQIIDLERTGDDILSQGEGFDTEMNSTGEEIVDMRKRIEDLRLEIQPFAEKHSELDTKIWDLLTIVYNPLDCADVQIKGNQESGIHTIYPYRTVEKPLNVLCDMESNGGGWTVFFKRQQQDQPIDFNESWENFKNGFGNISTEHWLGNDLIHLLTSYGPSMLRIDAEDFSGDKRWAEWGIFDVGDENSKYQLTVGKYQNTSIMGDSLSEDSNSSFTTFDQDNDDRPDGNCATGDGTLWGKGGWWYKNCGSARLTAPFTNTNYWNSASYGHWDTEGVKLVSLKNLSVKFRRLNYKQLADAFE